MREVSYTLANKLDVLRHHVSSLKNSPYLGTETARAQGWDIVTQSRTQEIRQNHIFSSSRYFSLKGLALEIASTFLSCYRC
jgi:hypothetical protein